ncbi:MAG: nadE [Paenibacillaceae bacterium]|jgi:NAD+ synthase|nr:nadE [Paenibacillaceae bacterium]
MAAVLLQIIDEEEIGMNPDIQKDVIDALHVLPVIDAEEEIRRRVNFMKEYLLVSGAKGYVLGLSGGQDSTLTGKLAQLAVNELNEQSEVKTYRFIAVRLPYGIQKDEADAQEAIAFIQPDKVVTIQIKPAVDAAVRQFEEATGEKLSDFHKGNTKARERMKAQYDLAAHYGMLVLGTDHAAEAVTAFFTKHGDGACDLTPIFGLSKGQGKQLLQALDCPAKLYLKKPTADLEDLKPGLPDEEALGMTYDELDQYLEGAALSGERAALIARRYTVSEHKRRGPVTLYDDWWKKV